MKLQNGMQNVTKIELQPNVGVIQKKLSMRGYTSENSKVFRQSFFDVNARVENGQSRLASGTPSVALQ